VGLKAGDVGELLLAMVTVPVLSTIDVAPAICLVLEAVVLVVFTGPAFVEL